ncbi:hypothetical protein FISHEDRAFT_13966, partial [Fistulina hepatica ATCC 64428]
KTQKSTRKPSSRHPLSDSERRKRFFTSLCAQIDGGHFTNALKTCGKILRLYPNDTDALQTMLFLLLQTEQYTSALHHLDSMAGDHDFERAYTLYRLQREVDAQQLLNSMNGRDQHRGTVHLEAQLSYRQGSFDEALNFYNRLLDTADPQTEEHSDVLTNLQASQQHADFISSGYLKALDRLPLAIVATLENAPPAFQTKYTSPLLATPSLALPTKPKGTKVRMSRVPADITPGVSPAPDPERWLKKSERSNYAGAKRRRGGATQGS